MSNQIKPLKNNESGLQITPELSKKISEITESILPKIITAIETGELKITGDGGFFDMLKIMKFSAKAINDFKIETELKNKALNDGRND